MVTRARNTRPDYPVDQRDRSAARVNGSSTLIKDGNPGGSGFKPPKHAEKDPHGCPCPSSLYTTAGLKTASATLLTVPQTHQIAVVVPRSALGGLDLSTARYGVAMFGNSEAGEGIGFVRPVYSFEFWNNPPPGLEFVKSFRFGGGAGELDFGWKARTLIRAIPTPLT